MKKISSIILLFIISLTSIWGSLTVNAQSQKDLNGIYTQEETNAIKKRFERTYVLYILAKYKIINKAMYDYLDKNYEDIYQVLMSYDYIHGSKAHDTMIRAKKWAIVFLNNKKTTAQLHQMSINQEYYANLYAKKNTQNGLTWIPSKFTKDPNFNYMIEGIKNDKTTIKHAQEIADRIGIEYQLTLAWILTEQVRYALTERWEMKKFLTWVPMLLYLTKFSYWIGGIKSFTAEKIRNDSRVYWYGDELKVHNKISWEEWWKRILIDKYWQVAYPSYLIKNIITRWEKEWHSIAKKPGIIITLYNFWNTENKKPNANPKVGWADININWQTYNFGWLWEMFYWWMKIDKPFN